MPMLTLMEGIRFFVVSHSKASMRCITLLCHSLVGFDKQHCKFIAAGIGAAKSVERHCSFTAAAASRFQQLCFPPGVPIGH